MTWGVKAWPAELFIHSPDSITKQIELRAPSSKKRVWKVIRFRGPQSVPKQMGYMTLFHQ